MAKVAPGQGENTHCILTLYAPYMRMPCMLSATHGGIYRSISAKITYTHRHSLTENKGTQQATGLTISTIRVTMTEQINSGDQFRL